MSFVGTATVLIGVSVGFVLLVRKILDHRERARALRAIFISEANDLVGKPEFPDSHARLLIGMAAIPPGWATRYFVFRLVRDLFWARKKSSARNLPRLEQVPTNLQRKFVLAMFAFALSDSYRCVIFGRVFRTSRSEEHTSEIQSLMRISYA